MNGQRTSNALPGSLKVIEGIAEVYFVFREYYVIFDALPGSVKGYELCKLSVPFRGIEWHCTLRLQRQFEARWANVF